MRLYLDGMDNPNKEFENERRRLRRESAEHEHGRIKNTPEYLAQAAWIANNVLKIPCFISKEEADPHVAYEAVSKGLVPVTGDSDLIAYGVVKAIIVKSYSRGWYRIIDLQVDTEPGDYPLYDLYKLYGVIVFQLYAGCRGCDFTKEESGIKGIGYTNFMLIASVVEGDLDARSFSRAMWSYDNTKKIAIDNGMESAEEVESYLQRVVNIYSEATIYDEDSNSISMKGVKVGEATEVSRQHMAGLVDTKTQDPHSEEVMDKMKNLERQQLLHRTAEQESEIRGAKLPEGKTVEECKVGDLLDFIAARGGPINITKAEAIPIVKRYQLMEKEARPVLVKRNPNPNGLMYAKIDASGTRQVWEILQDMVQAGSKAEEDEGTYNLIRDTYNYYEQGLFDDTYDNIARIAPELKEGLIYRLFGSIGSNIDCKNIGDAFRRCLYNNDGTSYHGIAFVPNTNKVIILSKAHASMARDEKTRSKTPEYQPPEKQQYLVILEMIYSKTNDIEHKHSLGVFVGMERTYCGACVAGQGMCRHKPEKLWHQFHHWTDDRLGIDRPPTLDACSWVGGGKAFVSDVRAKIHELQSVKHCTNIEAQTKKMEKNAKRNITEGYSSEYVQHDATQKQNPSNERFSKQHRRCLNELYEELRNDT